MDEPILISLQALGSFSDDEFYHFCLDNPELKFERTAQGQIIIMPNTGGITGKLNSEINFQLKLWNKQANLGEVFDSSTSFRLPNTAVKSPDASWISNVRWQQLSELEKKQFPPLCPDFVIELRSETDRLPDLQNKMQEWLSNGCQLAWLIDPKTQNTHIYRPQQAVEILESFARKLSGENILVGFELDLSELVD